jgi:hypothetical protein
MTLGIYGGNTAWKYSPYIIFADSIGQGNTFDLLCPIVLIFYASLIYLLELSEYIDAQGLR